MRTRNLFALYIFLELIIVAIAIVWDGLNLEALHTATRFSGRLSLAFFSMMLLIRNQEWKSRTVSDYPYLLFAIIHGIHLIELIAYVNLSNTSLIPLRLLGGFVAYLLIFMTALLHSGVFPGRVSSQLFKRLEFVYYPYIWFIFFMAYLPRVMGKLPHAGGAYWEHILLFAWVILAGATALINRKRFFSAQHV